MKNIGSILKTMLLLSSLLFTLLTPVKADQSLHYDNTMTLAYFSLPPHVITTNDESSPQGAYIDYFEEEVAKRMKVNVQWVRQP